MCLPFCSPILFYTHRILFCWPLYTGFSLEILRKILNDNHLGGNWIFCIFQLLLTGAHSVGPGPLSLLGYGRWWRRLTCRCACRASWELKSEPVGVLKAISPADCNTSKRHRTSLLGVLEGHRVWACYVWQTSVQHVEFQKWISLCCLTARSHTVRGWPFIHGAVKLLGKLRSSKTGGEAVLRAGHHGCAVQHARSSPKLGSKARTRKTDICSLPLHHHLAWCQYWAGFTSVSPIPKKPSYSLSWPTECQYRVTVTMNWEHVMFFSLWSNIS